MAWTANQLLPLSVVASVTVFVLLWLVQMRTRNAGIVDAGWASTIGALAVLYAVLGEGTPARRIAIGAMGGIWGLRLGWHLFFDRVLGQPEEGRYVKLRQDWAHGFQLKMLAFYLAQAASVVVLALPFLIVTADARPFPVPTDIAALALWLGGWIGEAVADQQLKRFKADPASRGRTCRYGLWHYSRHPNYFFEWLMWCSYAVMAIGAPWGWLAFGSPIIILYLVLNVTGIPPTEEQALRSRGDDYRDYQRTTSAFVPWFPRGG